LKVFISNKLIELENDIMLLKLGSEGEDVKKLQIKLGVDPIGKFGPKTEAAVKDWQSKHGLTADGIVGDKTWGVIMGLTEQVSSPTVITEPAPVKSVGGLKLEGLRGHIPDAVIAQIPDTAAKFEINTPLRLAHFLAQCGHESGGFKAVNENLNYSAKGLLGTFGKYFDGTTAAQYEKKPEMIASRVYGNRMGNGDESTKEGYKFRGRGYIQLTGKSNYTKFGQFI
jgi:putative chitinase